MCVASHGINVFEFETSECKVVLGVLTSPHILPETRYQFPPTCGVPLSSPHHTSVTRVGPIWLDIKSIVSEQVIVSCLYIYISAL